MVTRKSQRQEPEESSIVLAVKAVEQSGRSLDIEAGYADSSPTTLDLRVPQEAKPCSHHRYVCAVCGLPLRRK